MEKFVKIIDKTVGDESAYVAPPEEPDFSKYREGSERYGYQIAYIIATNKKLKHLTVIINRGRDNVTSLIIKTNVWWWRGLRSEIKLTEENTQMLAKLHDMLTNEANTEHYNLCVEASKLGRQFVRVLMNPTYLQTKLDADGHVIPSKFYRFVYAMVIPSSLAVFTMAYDIATKWATA